MWGVKAAQTLVYIYIVRHSVVTLTTECKYKGSVDPIPSLGMDTRLTTFSVERIELLLSTAANTTTCSLAIVYYNQS